MQIKIHERIITLRSSGGTFIPPQVPKYSEYNGATTEGWDQFTEL